MTQNLLKITWVHDWNSFLDKNLKNWNDPLYSVLRNLAAFWMKIGDQDQRLQKNSRKDRNAQPREKFTSL